MVFLKIATGCGLNDDEGRRLDDQEGLTALKTAQSVCGPRLLLPDMHRCVLCTALLYPPLCIIRPIVDNGAILNTRQSWFSKTILLFGYSRFNWNAQQL
jgi:hypothetical protein